MDEPVQPGEILAKKYRVDRVLGVGGMGVVVAATHIELDQRVALKFMLAGVVMSQEAMARFQREARIAVKLRSEHVARVTDTGTLENGSPYIVMEYLEGTDLKAQLEQYGPMPVGFAAECIVQACDAIGEAHSHGVVHRDLKPANLFLTQRADGSPLLKVLDFGISKANNAADSAMGMTKTGVIMGSPLYMSPEQMRSLKAVDGRSDVWSLGVILYELLTTRTPFVSETFADLLLQVMTAPPPPLHLSRPDVPPEVASLVNRCLAKEPEARVQSVAEVASVLAPFCSASGVVIAQRVTALARRSGTTGDPRVTSPNVTTGSGMTGAGWAAPGPAAPSKAFLWVGLALGAVVLVGGGVTIASLAAGTAKAPAVVSAASSNASTSTTAPPAQTASPSSTTAPSTTASSAPVPASPTSPAPPEEPPPAVARPAPPAAARPHAPVQPSRVVETPAARPSSSPPPKANPSPGILDTSN